MNIQKIQRYDKIIKDIETHLRIFTHDSCITIYTYLTIFGRMTHNELLEKTGLGRATLFSSLKLLQEAELVKKGSNPDVKDKRKNTFYYAQEKSIDLGAIDNKFRGYLEQQGKFELYEKWLKNSISIPLGMVRTVSNIRVKQELKQQSTDEKCECITLYGIDSFADPNKIIEKIIECGEEIKKQRQERHDSKKPLKNPAMFSLIFFQINK